MRRLGFIVLSVGLALVLSSDPGLAQLVRKKSADKTAPMPPDEALKSAGLSPTDPDQLLKYLEKRTLTETDQAKLRSLIRDFGSRDFEVRQKASEEIERFGPAALGPLREAERDPDPEISYRATQAVKQLNKVRHDVVAAAAVRALVALRPPQATKVLIGFLPLAGDETLAEEIRLGLADLATRDGQADPALLAALADPSPVRRTAAYYALLEGGAQDALPQVKAAIAKETDTESRFRGLWSLALAAHDPSAIPDLIQMMPQLSRGRLWQLEDLLLQIAGESKPAEGKLGRTPEALAKARDAWLGWWKQAQGNINLATINYTPRVLGYTLLVEMDPRGFGNWRLTVLGPDDKETFRLSNVQNPSDARLLPNGHILVAEQNTSQVTERDFTGRVLKTYTLPMPLQVEPLPNGNLLVACRNEVREITKEGRDVFTYRRPGNQHDVTAAKRLPSGETLVLTMSNASTDNALKLDAKGKPVGKPFQLGRVQNIFASIDVIDENRVLITEYNRVAEYDLNTGKASWNYPLANPSGVQRLPNGNTLIASTQINKVVEVTESNEVVWDYPVRDGLRVLRAYRR